MKIVAGEVPWGQISYARWKRKNRIAQLKRTIARLTKENKKIKEGPTPFFSEENKAYKLLQNMDVPLSSSPEFAVDVEAHIKKLELIISFLLRALCHSARVKGKMEYKRYEQYRRKIELK